MDYVTFFWIYCSVITIIIWMTHIGYKNDKICELKEDVEVARDRAAKFYNLAEKNLKDGYSSGYEVGFKFGRKEVVDKVNSIFVNFKLEE